MLGHMVRELTKKWQKENPEKIRKWREENPERIREATRKWQLVFVSRIQT